MTSAQGMGGPSKVDQGPRPDTIPPVSGRTSRRKAEHITGAHRLRDEVLRLIEEEPRTVVDLVALTGASMGRVKDALHRLSMADLVFSRETGSAFRDAPLWHHWPTMIAGLRERAASRPVAPHSTADRVTGVRLG